jgi:hypothetical protein
MSEDSGNDSSQYPSKAELTERAERGDPVARLSVKARRIETGGAALTHDDSRTGRRGRKMSASVLRLARRLGSNPDELAKDIPDDTLRRTKYGVIEEKMPDGSIKFKDQIVK